MENQEQNEQRSQALDLTQPYVAFLRLDFTNLSFIHLSATVLLIKHHLSTCENAPSWLDGVYRCFQA